MLGIRCQICSWEVYGGFRVFGRGVRKKGGLDEPQTPPGYRPDLGAEKCPLLVAYKCTTFCLRSLSD